MSRTALLLLLTGCTSATPWNLDHAVAAIRAWHLQSDPEPLPYVKPCPIGNNRSLVAAICEHQGEWWGFFGVYHLSHGRVDWMALADREPDEQSIHSLRAVDIPGRRNPLLEVYGITHMGNGALYLYELRENRLILLLETKAVDFNADLEQFKGGTLESDYRDVNGDGFADVTLTGVIEEWDEKGKTLVASRPCGKVFLWNIAQGKFIEDMARQVGFGSTD
jgi:hypothetical protein